MTGRAHDLLRGVAAVACGGSAQAAPEAPCGPAAAATAARTAGIVAERIYKLEQRFIGSPLILRQGARRVPREGTIAPPASAGIPDHGPVDYRGAAYETVSFNAAAKDGRFVARLSADPRHRVGRVLP